MFTKVIALLFIYPYTVFTQVNKVENRKMMLERVMRQLRDPSTDLKAVAEATGLKYSWLSQLAKGRFTDPGVSKIEKLDSYFRAAA